LNLLMSDRPGFEADRVLIATTDFRKAPRALSAHRVIGRIHDALMTSAAVEDVAVASAAPFGTVTQLTLVRPADAGVGQDARRAHVSMVSPSYFRVMNTRVIEGVTFGASDTEHPGVVVVSTSLARALFAPGQAIGASIRVLSDPDRLYRIVGVVEDVKVRSLRDEPPPFVYFPWPSDASASVTHLLIRGVGSARRRRADPAPVR
jgi:hypothetical protein